MRCLQIVPNTRQKPLARRYNIPASTTSQTLGCTSKSPSTTLRKRPPPINKDYSCDSNVKPLQDWLTHQRCPVFRIPVLSSTLILIQARVFLTNLYQILQTHHETQTNTLNPINPKTEYSTEAGRFLDPGEPGKPRTQVHPQRPLFTKSPSTLKRKLKTTPPPKKKKKTDLRPTPYSRSQKVGKSLSSCP